MNHARHSAAIALTTLGFSFLAQVAGAEEPPLKTARLFFELNDSDGDLGIHGQISNDDPLKRIRVEDPREKVILSISAVGRLARQGLSEIPFESAEPSFDDLAPSDFFLRFPEGIYEVEGLALDGTEYESETFLSHVLVAPPEDVTVSGVPLDEECDDGGEAVSSPVVIEWAPVTRSHPTLGSSGPVSVQHYEVVVEIEGTDFKAKAVLPPDVTEFEVPAAVLELSDELKYEIIVLNDNGNQTAVESCFSLE
jgi:hypothetical protein